jgi:hypothetical protein
MTKSNRAAPGELAHHAPEQRTLKRHRRCNQLRGVDFADELLPWNARRTHQLCGKVRSARIDPLAHPASDLGFVGKNIHDARVETRFEQWKQLGAHAVTRDADVLIGFVFDKRDVSFSQPRAEIATPAAKQRPDDPAVARVHSGKAPGSGAAGHPQQDRFGLIVARVAERDDVRVEVRPRALEPFVPRRTGRVFDRPSIAARTDANVLAAGDDRPIERGRERRGEALVIAGGFSKLMVEMDQAHEAHFSGGVEVAEDVRQRHRI